MWCALWWSTHWPAKRRKLFSANFLAAASMAQLQTGALARQPTGEQQPARSTGAQLPTGAAADGRKAAGAQLPTSAAARRTPSWRCAATDGPAAGKRVRQDDALASTRSELQEPRTKTYDYRPFP